MSSSSPSGVTFGRAGNELFLRARDVMERIKGILRFQPVVINEVYFYVYYKAANNPKNSGNVRIPIEARKVMGIEDGKEYVLLCRTQVIENYKPIRVFDENEELTLLGPYEPEKMEVASK